MVNKQRITFLLQQFTDGTLSKEEYTELIRHFNSKGNDEDMFAAMDEIWKHTEEEIWHSEEETNRVYQNLIAHKEFNAISTPAPLPAIPVRKLWYRMAAAAVVLVAFSTALYVYTSNNPEPASIRFAQQDLAPGSNKATLTLADGRKINLNAAGNGELAKQSGISITKTKTGELLYTVTAPAGPKNTDTTVPEYNTITTPRGGEYRVNLPDGTSVWLNAASSLKFPVQFMKNERRVSLNGEAYFEVAKAVKQQVVHGRLQEVRTPFIVKTDRQEVQVLGTHFNVNAYANETTFKTTLLEGLVNVSLPGTLQDVQPKAYYLQPGQQAILKGNIIKVTTADTEEAMAWKNGIFLFNGQDLEGIMKQVERWYDVEVVFENNTLKRQTFTGTLSRFKNISQLLEVLETTGSVHFEMEGRRITAMK
ncbi:FecR family protein [Pedobacter sp. AW31-3R]|uniref:FecR family protein n=1 Tax=Pedobacter sp. AW31-3R TaxID=3445781 RepID=UPI003FA03B2E